MVGNSALSFDPGVANIFLDQAHAEVYADESLLALRLMDAVFPCRDIG